MISSWHFPSCVSREKVILICNTFQTAVKNQNWWRRKFISLLPTFLDIQKYKQNTENDPHNSPEEYFDRTIFIPCSDGLITVLVTVLTIETFRLHLKCCYPQMLIPSCGWYVKIKDLLWARNIASGSHSSVNTCYNVKNGRVKRRSQWNNWQFWMNVRGFFSKYSNTAICVGNIACVYSWSRQIIFIN